MYLSAEFSMVEEWTENFFELDWGVCFFLSEDLVYLRELEDAASFFALTSFSRASLSSVSEA